MTRYRLILKRTLEILAAAEEEQDVASKFYPAVDPDGNQGDHCGVTLQDEVEGTVYQEIMIPTGVTAISSVYAVVIPQGHGDLDWEVATDWFALTASEQCNAHSDSTSGTTTVTAIDGEAIDISAAFTGAVGNDVVGVAFTRDGDDALDTIAADVLYLGIYVSGT